jgi:hypothetical protein
VRTHGALEKALVEGFSKEYKQILGSARAELAPVGTPVDRQMDMLTTRDDVALLPKNVPEPTSVSRVFASSVFWVYSSPQTYDGPSLL